MPDGKKYVKADRQVIFGNDPESWSEQLEDYINGKIRRGQDVQLIAEDGDVLTLTATTAGKVSSRYKGAKTIPLEQYERKVNAGAHIDEIAKISTETKWAADKENEHVAFASKGWQYRTAYFLDFDGTYYRLLLSVAQSDHGNVVYNIGDMRKRSFPTTPGSSASGGAQSGKASLEEGKTPSKDIISAKEQKSNPKILDEDTGPRASLVDGGRIDIEYAKAVERGDMEAAQDMVDEAAKAAMPDTKIKERMEERKGACYLEVVPTMKDAKWAKKHSLRR